MGSHTGSRAPRGDFAMLNPGGGAGASTHDMLTSLARSHGLKAIQARHDRVRRAHKQRAVIAQAHEHSRQQQQRAALQAARLQSSVDGRSTTSSTGSTTYHSALHENISVASRPATTSHRHLQHHHQHRALNKTHEVVVARRETQRVPAPSHPKTSTVPEQPKADKFDFGNFLQGMLGMKPQKPQGNNLSVVMTETSSDSKCARQNEVSKTSSSLELSQSPKQSSGSTPPANNLHRPKNSPPPIPETIVIDTAVDD